jgi:hypothetical protein
MACLQTKMLLRSIRVEKKDISYVRWMLESHDGLATPTTRPGTNDILDFLVAPDFADEFDDLLSALSKEIFVEAVEQPTSTSLQA